MGTCQAYRNKIIHIGGDSWGCGEWSHDSSSILHKGLEQYLLDDGYNVYNTSQGDSSNKDAIDRIIVSPSSDLLIWFQTDPMRDLRPFVDIEINSYEYVINLSARLLEQSYQRLDTLGIPVYCIGGVTKLDLDKIKSYNNLIPIIPSAVEMLTPYRHPIFWKPGWTRKISRNIDIKCLREIHRHVISNEVFLSRACPEYFYPDGCHLNRHGHQKVYEVIKEIL